MSNLSARLRQTVQRLRTEPGLGRNALAVTVVMVIGVTVGGFILGRQQFNPPWQDTTLVWGTFREAVGVAPGRGQEVRISGVRVGDIRDIRVNDKGQAQLLLAVDQDLYGEPIYDNATMVLRPKSPLNEMYVEVNPGGPPAEPLPQEGQLPVTSTRSPVQIDQPLGHLDEKALDALQALLSASDQAMARAPRDLPAGLTATDAVVNDLKPVMVELDRRRENLATLITSLSQVSEAFGENDAQLASLVDSLHTTLGTVDRQSGSLQAALARFPELTGDLDQAAHAVGRLTGQLDPTLDNVKAAADTMPEALSRITDTVEKLDGTLEKAGPVARKLRPVVRDLRPFTMDADAALADLSPIVHDLAPMTAGLVPYLPDLGAFVYQTNSLTSLRDANGGILRGMVQFGPTTLPVAGLDDLSPTQR